MSQSLRQFNSITSTTSVTTLAGTISSLPVQGNWLYAFVEIIDSASPGQTITPPTGWTQVGVVHDFGAGMAALFKKKATASEATSYSFSWGTASSYSSVSLVEVTGTVDIDVSVIGKTSNSVSTATTGTITPSAAGELILAFFSAYYPRTPPTSAAISSPYTSDSSVLTGPSPQIAHKASGTTSESATVTWNSTFYTSYALLALTPIQPLAANPSSLVFASPTSAAQTVAITGGVAPYSISTAPASIASASLSGGNASPLSVNPTNTGTGNTSVTVSSSDGQTVTVSVAIQGQLTVQAQSAVGSNPQVFLVTEANFSGTITPSCSDPSVAISPASATMVPAGVTFTATASKSTTFTLTFTDSNTPAKSVSVSAQITFAATVRDLLAADTITRLMHIQVWRNGNWQNVNVTSAKAKIGRGKAGELVLEVPDDGTTNSQLYEGERIRVYRGVQGVAPIRCWTGVVDIREPQLTVSNSGIVRTITVTDNIKELIEAKTLAGVIYDGWTPNAAAADAVQRAINTQQYMVYDDNGNQLTSVANYNQKTGNGICYFPDLYNDDGSVFTLPTGTIASFGTPSSMASFSVPVPASGVSYAVFEATKQYFVGSSVVMPGWTVASTAASLPPPASTVVFDFYNGMMYFNPADASRTVSMTASYFDRPLYEVQNGKPVNDIIQEIWSKIGCNYWVDGSGKLQAASGDIVQAPKRVYTNATAVDLGVQINRDRRNVLLCLGWDDVCGGVIAAKAVNYDDITKAPPKGLGKRAYMYMQDKKWNTMWTVLRAVMFAILRVSRRGKLASVKILDDPSLNWGDVIAFSSPMPEIDPNDFFFIEEMEWEFSKQNDKIVSLQTLMGNAISGQGTFYFGPISGATAEGQMDLTADVRPISGCALAAPTANLATNSDTLSGWPTVGTGVLANGGPGGVIDWEYTGNGGASGFSYIYRVINVTAGKSYTPSAWADPSQILAGTALIALYDPTLNTQYTAIGVGAGTGRTAIQRYGAAAWKCPTNLAPHSDDLLSGWFTGASVVIGSNGPSGAKSFNYTVSGTQTYQPAYAVVSVNAGNTISWSAWCNPSCCSSGGLWFRILDDASGGLLYQTTITGSDGRHSASFAVPSGYPKVRVVFGSDSSVGVIPSGNTVIFSQPMIVVGADPGYYVSSTNPQVALLMDTTNCTVANGKKLKFSQPMLRADGVSSPYMPSSVPGGNYYSTFSLAAGLSLVYTTAGVAGLETIQYYRPDGTYGTISQNVARAASTQFTVPLAVTGINPGDLVVVKLYFRDNNGNVGVYRDWIQAIA